ncbi:MAG: hypothetical protein IJD45_01635 [Clostridia bacterium]|nr:hypothetical protein [Clostridia bacterium]
MKKAILLLLCCGLVMCSACNNAEPPLTESSSLTVLETKTTEIETDTSSVIEESITTEKEESTPVESEPVKTASVVATKDEPRRKVRIKEAGEPTQEIESEYEDIVEQEIADSAEVERLIVKYINEFRMAQSDTTATVLPGLTEVARYRANQLIDNFAHVDIREACGELKYGRYFDMTEYGMDAKYNYYEGYDREAICKGEWFGTANMIAKNIAEGFKNSTKHWDYVGDSKYGYIAVGVTYNEADKYWYGCVCMSTENYGG